MTNTEIKSKINYKKIDIEDHAVKRAMERFKRKDKVDALKYCCSLLGSSRYVGETTCDRGNQAHMFIAPNKVEIYLTLDLTLIRTLMMNNEKKYIVYDDHSNDVKDDQYENIFSQVKEIPLQDKLIKLYQKEFKIHDRLEIKMKKEFTEYRLLKSIEIAELNLQSYKSKSKKVRLELSDKVRQIETTISNNLLELKKLQDDKRKISKALSSLLMVF